MTDHEIRIPPAAVLREKLARNEKERRTLHALLKAAMLDQGEYRRVEDHTALSGSGCEQQPGLTPAVSA